MKGPDGSEIPDAGVSLEAAQKEAAITGAFARVWAPKEGGPLMFVIT
jgi:hypothetical protein